MKVIIEKSKYPIVLRDYLSIGKKKARVKIEIHEDKVISFLDSEEDFFAEGKTVKEAKDNPINVMLDEKEFFERHKEELGKPSYYQIPETPRTLWKNLRDFSQGNYQKRSILKS